MKTEDCIKNPIQPFSYEVRTKMKTITFLQLGLILVAFALSLEDASAYMKRVRAAPKSRSDAEKRRLKYKNDQQKKEKEQQQQEKKAEIETTKAEVDKQRELWGIFSEGEGTSCYSFVGCCLVCYVMENRCSCVIVCSNVDRLLFSRLSISSW